MFGVAGMQSLPRGPPSVKSRTKNFVGKQHLTLEDHVYEHELYSYFPDYYPCLKRGVFQSKLFDLVNHLLFYRSNLSPELMFVRQRGLGKFCTKEACQNKIFSYAQQFRRQDTPRSSN